MDTSAILCEVHVAITEHCAAAQWSLFVRVIPRPADDLYSSPLQALHSAPGACANDSVGGGGVPERLPGDACEDSLNDGGSGSSANGGTMASRDLDIDGVFVPRGGSMHGHNLINHSLAAAKAVLAEKPGCTAAECAA